MNGPISAIVGGDRHELASMSWDDYLAFPALNGSVIVHGRKSLRHLKHAWDEGFNDTDARQFGRLLHCLLFEPSEVETRYRPWEGTRRGRAYDDFVEEAEDEGAEVVRAEGQYSLASALRAAQCFLRCDRIKQLTAAGQAEQTVLAPECGLQCKGRLDWVSTAEHVLTDLKTSAQIEPELFGRSFFRFGYDIKLGLYKRWLDSVTGDRWPVEVIVLESTPPYDIAPVPIPDAVLDAGVDKAIRIIEKVRHAIDVDEWPGVAGAGYLPLVVPWWEMQEDLVGFEDAP